MKQKFLLKTMLLLCALVAGTSMSWADTKTFSYTDFTGQGTSGSGSAMSGATKGDITVTGVGYGASGHVKIYASGTLTITPNNGATVTSIVLTAVSGYIKTWLASDDSSVTISGNTATWTGTSTSAITLTNNTSAQARITGIEVTYTPSGSGSSAVETTTTIDDTGITNTDVNAGTAAGTLTATVTPEGGSALDSPTITWSSSNESVATVDSDGSVTLVAAGTTTITASYAGVVDTYQSSYGTYNLMVTNSAPATLPFNWAGGTSAALKAETGVTASGLGSDYAAGNAPYIVKFDDTNDYIQIKTDSQPDKVTIGVKMLGGATTSTITVQASENGVDFDGGEVLTISGAANAVLTLETTRSFDATDCYVRLVFTKGSNVGVGPITISKYTPPVAVTGVSIKSSTTLKVGDTETLTATVSPDEASNKNVTWTSSNDAIATVDASGVVRGVAVGVATITVTSVADNTKKATCEVTVTADATKPSLVETIFEETFTGCTGTGGNKDGDFSNGSQNGSVSGKTDQTWSTITNVYPAAACGRIGTGSADGTLETTISLTGNATLTFSGAGWKGSDTNTLTITATGATLSGDKNVTFTNAVWNDYTVNISGATGSVTLNFTGKRGFIDDIKITYNKITADVTLSATGYASYCSPFALDLTPTADYAAYAVTGTSSSTVTFTKIPGKVAANTPFILFNEDNAGKTVNLPIIEDDDPAIAAVGSNMLSGTLSPTYITTVTGDYTNFGLSGGSFVKINTGTINANKAYLPVLTANLPSLVKEFTIIFEDDADGIEETLSDSPLKGENIYNLAGQRLSKMQKGINIVNGKKILK